ncbi:hypothetical protein RF11_07634 [Thelohanellus kitauei]|uniref:Uncharacterized protein n=1 Tax=Thelohanellus kitauei TaxID=669202 RepID=A0A0C2NFS7_THEKT|nr:hypothetical protein RF11_07634 [Thelohanellus kitauei]
MMVIISETAVVDYAQQIFQILHLFAVYSSLVVVKEKFFQLRKLNWNKKLNLFTYLVGLLATMLYPMIFIFDMEKFKWIHYGITAFTMMFYALYYWLLSAAIYFVFKTYKGPTCVIVCFVLRFLTNILGTMTLIVQVAGIYLSK